MPPPPELQNLCSRIQSSESVLIMIMQFHHDLPCERRHASLGTRSCSSTRVCSIMFETTRFSQHMLMFVKQACSSISSREKVKLLFAHTFVFVNVSMLEHACLLCKHHSSLSTYSYSIIKRACLSISSRVNILANPIS